MCEREREREREREISVCVGVGNLRLFREIFFGVWVLGFLKICVGVSNPKFISLLRISKDRRGGKYVWDFCLHKLQCSQGAAAYFGSSVQWVEEA